MPSVEDRLLALPSSARPAALTALQAEGLPIHELSYRPWWATARPEQIIPEGDYLAALYLAGRGAGKTRAGAEWVIDQSLAGPIRGALASATFRDAEKVMVKGESGILACAQARGIHCEYRKGDQEVTFPSGAAWTIFTAEKPESFRGPQHHRVWADEVAAWHQNRRQDAWDLMMFGLRLGANPHVLVTTTPKPIQLLRDLLAADDTYTIRSSTMANARNLPPKMLRAWLLKYEGTRLWRQEIEGALLDDVEGALWQPAWIDQGRVTPDEVPELTRVAVAVDPAVTVTESSDETGIVVAGRDAQGDVYVLADRSAKTAGEDAARRAWRAFLDHQADVLIYEANQGGVWVAEVLADTWRTMQREGQAPKDVRPPIKATTANVGKALRAQPVALRYEQCIAEGSLVETERGPIPIELVRAGDRVWTRRGLRSVTWAGRTGILETVEIETADGQVLRCTPEHRVWSETRGWVHAERLDRNDRLLAWRNIPALTASAPWEKRTADAIRAAFSTAGTLARTVMSNAATRLSTAFGTTKQRTDTTGRHVSTGEPSCTAQYGNTTTDQSPKGGTSTIATTTPETTKSGTSSPCRCEITWPENTATTTTATAPMSGNRSARRRLSGGETGSTAPAPATGAETSTAPAPPAPGSVPPHATRPTGMTRRKPSATVPVYDLEVEDAHEFFASGILVHNSRVHHVHPVVTDDDPHPTNPLLVLESQMCEWVPDAGKASPDRIDALVWAVAELLGDAPAASFMAPPEARIDRKAGLAAAGPRINRTRM
jgi:phage terminase large subunit-like protein